MRVNCVGAYLTSLCYVELHSSRGPHASVLVSTLYLIVKGGFFSLLLQSHHLSCALCWNLQVWMSDVVPPTALSEVQLRFLCHDDIENVKLLCGDWFPIE